MTLEPKQRVSELFKELTCETAIEMSSGVRANSYKSGFVVIEDTTNLSVIECADDDSRADMVNLLKTTNEDSWPWAEWSVWCQYPNDPIDTLDLVALSVACDVVL